MGAAAYLDGHYAIGPLMAAPVTPTIGAMVAGLDPGRLPDSREVAAIREALRRHKVIFFPEQRTPIADFVAFARALGPIQRYAPAMPAAAGHEATANVHPDVHVFDYGEAQRGRENFWHFDVLPNRTPARASMLRARIVPPVGGDTLFCDLCALYDSLPAGIKTRLDGATGVYDMVFQRRMARFRGVPESEVMAMSPEPLAEAPLVGTDPATGRRSLMLNPAFLVAIKDMSAADTIAVVDDVRARINRPEFQCRFRWQPGQIALWDNHACLHYATNNYWPMRRVMERITLTAFHGE
jgi:taurine dioxygenase